MPVQERQILPGNCHRHHFFYNICQLSNLDVTAQNQHKLDCINILVSPCQRCFILLHMVGMQHYGCAVVNHKK